MSRVASRASSRHSSPRCSAHTLISDHTRMLCHALILSCSAHCSLLIALSHTLMLFVLYMFVLCSSFTFVLYIFVLYMFVLCSSSVRPLHSSSRGSPRGTPKHSPPGSRNTTPGTTLRRLGGGIAGGWRASAVVSPQSERKGATVGGVGSVGGSNAAAAAATSKVSRAMRVGSGQMSIAPGLIVEQQQLREATASTLSSQTPSANASRSNSRPGSSTSSKEGGTGGLEGAYQVYRMLLHATMNQVYSIAPLHPP
jgi:hypothetical protein